MCSDPNAVTRGELGVRELMIWNHHETVCSWL